MVWSNQSAGLHAYRKCSNAHIYQFLHLLRLSDPFEKHRPKARALLHCNPLNLSLFTLCGEYKQIGETKQLTEIFNNFYTFKDQKTSYKNYCIKPWKHYWCLGYICEFLSEFLSDFLRMDSVESSLKRRSIVETSEALIARLKPRAANT